MKMFWLFFFKMFLNCNDHTSQDSLSRPWLSCYFWSLSVIFLPSKGRGFSVLSADPSEQKSPKNGQNGLEFCWGVITAIDKLLFTLGKSQMSQALDRYSALQLMLTSGLRGLCFAWPHRLGSTARPSFWQSHLLDLWPAAGEVVLESESSDPGKMQCSTMFHLQ